jgi:hypothetical protein
MTGDGKVEVGPRSDRFKRRRPSRVLRFESALLGTVRHGVPSDFTERWWNASKPMPEPAKATATGGRGTEGELLDAEETREYPEWWSPSGPREPAASRREGAEARKAAAGELRLLRFVLEARHWRLIDLAAELARAGDDESARSLANALLEHCTRLSLAGVHRLRRIAGDQSRTSSRSPRRSRPAKRSSRP